ncbi:spliceosomal protein [Tritrichomonas foetus]|uniref:Spliceosomal protein n=1 Tax=Tritrichomonas foetus TaxID=1144522 RepID=A0A1J4KNW3_9EUKA|nr:spliceosomal protein [Tritrichomonas foetus]|eukprot:OHT12802.1 spliceosomal protein [Tritrichomonas foetus]
MSSSRHLHQNKEATVYVGDLSDHVTEDILMELFIQCGPIVSLNIPRDRITNRANGYGFVEFSTAEDARYAATIMNGVRLFGSPIKTGSTTTNDEQLDVGAKLYIGNLAPDVTDLTLRQLFKPFGNLITCRVVLDPATGLSRGHGFISYDTFEAADAARAALHCQYVMNQPITVVYAFKQESKSGEKHGDKTERLVAPSALAAQVAKKVHSHISLLDDKGM